MLAGLPCGRRRAGGPARHVGQLYLQKINSEMHNVVTKPISNSISTSFEGYER